MSLEATLILLDNSAFAINGDYEPTRWLNEVDCAQLLIETKLEANQQSSVGVSLMGGSQVQILCTFTSDSMKAKAYFKDVKCNGQLHFTQAIQIGALSLKHRSNQTQKPRMVCFIGSKIVQDIQTLKILAKKLKKNGVAVDVVCFGDCSQQQIEKAQTFVTTLQNEDNSHLLVVKPGEILLDKLIGSPIIGGGNAGAGAMANIQEQDPDLAAAIRMSLEESQQALQRAAPQAQPQAASQPAQVQQEAAHEPTEEQLQQLAIQMSLAEFNSSEAKGEQGDKPEGGEKKE